MAVVGGGIGGLAAAHRLLTRAAERGQALEVVVLEAGSRAGGVLASELYEGALLEHGPDTLVTHKPAAVALCERLGLGERLVAPPAGRTEILFGGRLLPIPAGFALLAPTRWRPLLTSQLLSWSGKLRALGEPHLAARGVARPGGAPADESVAAFVRRHFGAEVLARLAEPMVGAIYMADVERLSLAATFPRFRDLERERGAIAPAWWRRARAAPPAPARPPLVALSGGLGQLATALVARLPAGALRLATRVERLARAGEGFALELAQAPALAVDAVVLAVPAPRAAALLRGLDPRLAAQLGETAYASCATVNLGWPRAAVGRPPDGLGFFVPRSARSPVVAASFVSVKFPERVRADEVVARVFLGGARDPRIDARADEELVELATAMLSPLLALRHPPAWRRVYRHAQAMPQAEVGHLDRVAAARARAEQLPGLELAGGPLGAYGVPDAIAAGEAAAERLLAWLDRRDAVAAPARVVASLAPP